ncbi:MULTISPECIES: histidine phosphatase family protein [unclassified Pseudomonas]|uniref:histidine phosphatase family protein n=1 Tax=unclassified Pseudomonas TaxID=196821 RepID=UPI000875FFB8|nr:MULTISPECIES: histidine phosphatase family protein [unclassified Pseudomonas]SCZ30851.1 Broad specificity phosphatase PhoE [Pseudomonas sp. NFACC44-2]SDA41133.1 Broad specificity phosphatase PhoE [Pseudomonas sp. NFACC51]SEI58341.1 Broad specificity phosphatase PhoE [Pseudomonas sp. NFACC07-1]SFH51720.1 Broad specificity phosphatase PhoE [Pseudomonas sp. NFACC54]SFL09724.1 Broad specificity phosphatase PhoE [Pseudomonas sp. NFACC46-3]
MQATRLTLICHARTAAQKQARFGLDEPLDADWLARRAQVGHRYRNVRQLLCGPELRTRQTAALFGDEPEQDLALADCDLGRWRGLSIDDLLQAEPQALQSWLDDAEAAPHGGESVAQLCRRVGTWLASLETRPGHLLAVTHPFVIRAALVNVLGCPAATFNRIDIEPLSTLELRFNGVWRLRTQGPDQESPR